MANDGAITFDRPFYSSNAPQGEVNPLIVDPKGLEQDACVDDFCPKQKTPKELLPHIQVLDELLPTKTDPINFDRPFYMQPVDTPSERSITGIYRGELKAEVESDRILTTTYIYSTDVGGHEFKTTWTTENKDDVWQFHGENMKDKMLMVTSPSQTTTQSFDCYSKSGNNFYSIRREGDILFARSENNGKKVKKVLSLNGDAWVQEFDFSLKPYVLSKANDFKFSIVNPKDLSLHNMIASKQGLDQIDINGKQFTAQKVKITLCGFKKMFWHADLWFDQKTGDLLRYEANDGPNTPMRIITFLSKENVS
jgi:hypothetical protein